MGNWINLQLIYNQQTDGDRNQKSLETAMEHFGIEQTRVAHDALGDAYNTGLVCSKLDILDGITHYGELTRQLSKKVRVKPIDDNSPEPIEHIVTDSYDSKDALWTSKDLSELRCPDCGSLLTAERWVNQGDRRYMTMIRCEEHGSFLVRARIRHEENDSWHANRLIYRANEEMVANFKAKQRNPRRRHRKKKPQA